MNMLKTDAFIYIKTLSYCAIYNYLQEETTTEIFLFF